MQNRFTRNRQGKPTYICHCCGKLTRETGNDESSLDLCLLCMLEAEAENAESDYGEDSEQYRNAMVRVEAQKAKEAKK